MRVVRSAGELDASLDAARREAKAAFGDDTVFFERYIESAQISGAVTMVTRKGRVAHLPLSSVA
jgi:pyruvate carboxylase